VVGEGLATRLGDGGAEHDLQVSADACQSAPLATLFPQLHSLESVNLHVWVCTCMHVSAGARMPADVLGNVQTLPDMQVETRITSAVVVHAQHAWVALRKQTTLHSTT
jgi:hypothetical protein